MVGQKKYEQINYLLNKKLEKNKILVAVHRGTWGGNIIENTIPAYEACLLMGGDMFECDLSNSTDGTLYCIHDGGEKRLFGRKENIKSLNDNEIEEMLYLNSLMYPSGYGIIRFEEVLKHFTNGELFNIDRAWWFLRELDQVMQSYPSSVQQAVIKTPVKKEYLDFFNNCPTKYMYMPIAYNMDEIYQVLSYKEINTVGVEIIAQTADSELIQEENINWIREQGLYVWVNTIVLSGFRQHILSGGFDDDVAMNGNPDGSWGQLVDRGVNVLQTDWPFHMRQYLNGKLDGKG